MVVALFNPLSKNPLSKKVAVPVKKVTVPAAFNKDLLGWYLITLKLRETIGPGNPSCPTSGTRCIECPDPEQKPPESLQIPINESPVSEWVISMKEKLDQAQQDEAECPWAQISIYKIPRCLRDIGGDDKAFVPQIVSLGPYHHGKRRLRQMDRHKWRSLQHVLKRTNHDIQLYLDSMKEIEERARSCYEGPISLSSNEFVEMLVLDGCFVLELFRGAKEGFENLGYSRNDPIFAIRGSMHSIQRDMIMLENQLPLFVLDRLLRIQLCGPNLKGRVANLALRFFDPLMPTVEALTKSEMSKWDRLFNAIPHLSLWVIKMVFTVSIFFRRSLLRPGPQRPSLQGNTPLDPLGDQDGLHCLDVFRRSLLRPGPPRSPEVPVADKRRQQLIHCVTELKEAGIKFRKSETDRFWDIEFKNGILRMPGLLIHDGTKSLFSNLIAFEQSHLDCGNEFTSYAIFMDNLINSPADVGYLHYCGIIEHWLGSDAEVADLFNRLCQEVVFDLNKSYLSSLSGDVNRYYNHKWNTWRAKLKHNYFSNPWAIISLVAAVVLLLLTVAQTFYTIYGYYRPGS